MSNILEIKDLYFKYDEDYVLEGLNLNVEEGKFIAIIGENGCGKSTLLQLILHNLKPEEGSIHLFEDSIDKNNHYKDIAYISQNAVLNYKYFPTTIEEVIKNHLKFMKKKVDIEKYLDLIGLKGHEKKALSELSGGQLQRVGLVLALIKDAKLILLDEPTTGIDKNFIHQLFTLLKDLTSYQKTIMMVTHELAEAAIYTDETYQIKEGKIYQCEGGYSC